MKIGLVGLGRMGAAIAARLRDCGCEIVAWDRREKACEAAKADGSTIVATPRAVAEAADTVLSIITEDGGVRHVFAGTDGFLSADVTGKLFIEMSTLRPATHRELAPLVASHGAALVDSPVLGSIPNVGKGALFALVGGQDKDVERARGVLSHLTRRIEHIGPNGAGAAMKLTANLMMGLYLQSLAEALSLGQSEGIAVERALEVLSDSIVATPFLQSKAAIIRGEDGDITLDIRTLRKDMMSALATGTANGAGLPAASGALASLSAAVAGGWGEKDLGELPRYFREHMLQAYD